MLPMEIIIRPRLFSCRRPPWEKKTFCRLHRHNNNQRRRICIRPEGFCAAHGPLTIRDNPFLKFIELVFLFFFSFVAEQQAAEDRVRPADPEIAKRAALLFHVGPAAAPRGGDGQFRRGVRLFRRRWIPISHRHLGRLLIVRLGSLERRKSQR